MRLNSDGSAVLAHRAATETMLTRHASRLERDGGVNPFGVRRCYSPLSHYAVTSHPACKAVSVSTLSVLVVWRRLAKQSFRTHLRR